MTIRELSKCTVSEMRITFDEDPHDGQIDVIIPLSSSAEEILGDAVLDMEINLIKAEGNALIISTCAR
jgi:hypothetical protein